MRLDVRVLYFRRCIHTLKDFVRLAKADCDVTIIDVIAAKHIALILETEAAFCRERLRFDSILMEHRRFRLHRLEQIIHRRQWLIFDFD